MKRKVGIIGYGWVAGANHKNSYAQAKDVEIVAVGDVNKAALERAKRDYNLPDEALFDDYKKLIDSGLCDMVDICTLLLKGLGVVTLTQLCADMCRQSGESSLAGGVELAGKAELLLLCLPYMERLTETAIQLLELGQ